MTKKVMFTDREAWLTEAANLILGDIIMPEVDKWDADTQGDSFPMPTFRISVGFPKHSRGGKAIAVCFKKEASTEGINEIFINPEIDDPIAVLEAVTHELIHAVDNCASGHRNFFVRIARGAGLEGKPTATFAGDLLKGVLESYSVLLGQFPHNRMEMTKVHKKDSTRQLKVECNACGLIFRASQKWSMQINENESPCPVCLSNGTLRKG